MPSTTGAAGGFREVRVFNHETASCRRIDEVDFRTVKMRIEFSLRCEHYAGEVVLRIDRSIERSIKVEGVMHSAASAAKDTDSQKRVVLKALCFLDPFYFVSRYWSY